jgi:hypothetical protein
MDPREAAEQIKKACNAISLEMMKIHPATNALEDKQTKDEIFKTLFELTKNVELIKKLMRKLELKMSADPNAGDVPPVL